MPVDPAVLYSVDYSTGRELKWLFNKEPGSAMSLEELEIWLLDKGFPGSKVSIHKSPPHQWKVQA